MSRRDRVNAKVANTATAIHREKKTSPQMAQATSPPNRGGETLKLTFTKTGGSAGNLTTQCSFTYTLTNALTDVELATGVNPTASPHKHQRQTVGYYKQATFGLAYKDEGVLVLAYCNEIPDAEACT
jgi:hypothetical protein